MLNVESGYTWKSILLEIFLWVRQPAVVIPLLIALLGSFKTRGEATYFDLRLPSAWQFSNYGEVFRRSNLTTAFLNSIVITGCSVAIIVLLSTLCSFVLSRRVTRFTRFVNTFFTLGIIVPLSIIPAILVMKTLHLLNTRYGISCSYVGYKLAWSIFLLTGFIDSIPRDIDGAAIVDGCTPITTVVRVFFPQLSHHYDQRHHYRHWHLERFSTSVLLPQQFSVAPPCH